MRFKIYVLSFILAFASPLLLYSEDVSVARSNIIEYSREFVDGLINTNNYAEKWEPKITFATNPVTNTVIFKSFFTTNGYLYQRGELSPGNPSGNFEWKNKGLTYFLGRRDGTNSIYWVVPYSLGGFDNPLLVSNRVKAMSNEQVIVPGSDLDESFAKIGPVCPGGFTKYDAINGNPTNLSNNVNYIFDTNSHYKNWGNYDVHRKYISGIDCIGFVSKALGFQFMIALGIKPLSQMNTIYSVSLKLEDYDKMKNGDFIVREDYAHTRLFLEKIPTEGKYLFREATPPFVRDISYSKYELEHEEAKYSADGSLINPGKKYYGYTIFPQFVLSAEPKVYKEVEAPTNFNVTINTGYKISGILMSNFNNNTEISGFNYTTYTETLNYTTNGVSFSKTYNRERATKLNIPISYTSTSNPNLQKAEFSITAANTFGQKDWTMPRNPDLSDNSYVYTFSDTTNFTFYRYSGSYPPVARAIIIADGDNNILAYYRFYEEGGKVKLEKDNIIDAGKLKQTSRIKIYAGFSSDMDSGVLSFIKTSTLGAIGVEEGEDVGNNLQLQIENRIDFSLTSSDTTFFTTLKFPAGLKDKLKSDGLNWMAREMDVSKDDLLGVNVISLSGKDKNGREIDANPLTKVELDLNKAEAGEIAFINYEKSPMCLTVYFDNKVPILTYLKITSSSRGKLGEWDVSQLNNGQFGVIEKFNDIGKESITIELKAEDDGELMGSHTYIFLIPDEKEEVFKQKRVDYVTSYDKATDNIGRLNAFIAFLNEVKNIGGIGVIEAGKNNGVYKGWKKLGAGKIRSRTKEYYWSSDRIDLTMNANVNEIHYKIALLMTDNGTYHRLSALTGAGGIAKSSNGMLAICDDPLPPNPEGIEVDGCFLSPEFAVDFTAPQFNIIGMLSDIMKGIVLQFADNLSKGIVVNLKVMGNDGADKAVWSFKINKLDQVMLSGDWSKAEVETISGPLVNVKSNGIEIKWDGKDLSGLSAIIQGAFNGKLYVEVVDNAGNSASSLFDIDLENIVLEAAKKALLDALGVSDKSLIIAPGISAGG